MALGLHWTEEDCAVRGKSVATWGVSHVRQEMCCYGGGCCEGERCCYVGECCERETSDGLFDGHGNEWHLVLMSAGTQSTGSYVYLYGRMTLT